MTIGILVLENMSRSTGKMVLFTFIFIIYIQNQELLNYFSQSKPKQGVMGKLKAGENFAEQLAQRWQSRDMQEARNLSLPHVLWTAFLSGLTRCMHSNTPHEVMLYMCMHILSPLFYI